MAHLATLEFLGKIKTLYPEAYYIVAVVAFNAANEPDAVPVVFQYALQDASTHEERLIIAQKVRDALYKGAVTSGFAKAINSFIALDKIMPAELKPSPDHIVRDPKNLTFPQLEAHGAKFFKSVYGETTTSVQTLLDQIYPDLGYFCNTVAYGMVYGDTQVLTPLESSYCLIGTLIASDTPRQINWHLKGARRVGGTLEQVQAVRTIAMEVSNVAGVKWKAGVPELEE